MSWPNGAHARLQAVGDWPLSVKEGGGEGRVGLMGEGGCLEVHSVWLPGMEAGEGEEEKGKERAALLTTRLVSAACLECLHACQPNRHCMIYLVFLLVIIIESAD